MVLNQKHDREREGGRRRGRSSAWPCGQEAHPLLPIRRHAPLIKHHGSYTEIKVQLTSEQSSLRTGGLAQQRCLLPTSLSRLSQRSGSGGNRRRGDQTPPTPPGFYLQARCIIHLLYVYMYPFCLSSFTVTNGRMISTHTSPHTIKLASFL